MTPEEIEQLSKSKPREKWMMWEIALMQIAYHVARQTEAMERIASAVEGIERR